MCKYMCALLTFIILMAPPVCPFQTEREFQKKTSPEAAKQATSIGDQEKPRFEVISIKPASSKPTASGAYASDLKFLPGGKFIATNFNLNGLISTAYEIPLLQVMGMPKFIEKAYWNIEAKPEEGKYLLKAGLLDPHVGHLMIQSMLEDRFKLKVHQERRILPGYELVIAKGGPKIKLSKEQSKQISGAIMPGGLIAPSMPLSSLAGVLSLQLNFWEGDQKRIHVLDKTGLEGLYSINLHWTPDLNKAPHWPKPSADEPEITLFEAIQDQLGLKLAPADLPTPVVVVDEVQMPKTN
jgi:uncharacterized protein (TIGR03435 family)